MNLLSPGGRTGSRPPLSLFLTILRSPGLSVVPEPCLPCLSLARIGGISPHLSPCSLMGRVGTPRSIGQALPAFQLFRTVVLTLLSRTWLRECGSAPASGRCSCRWCRVVASLVLRPSTGQSWSLSSWLANMLFHWGLQRRGLVLTASSWSKSGHVCAAEVLGHILI